MTSDDQKVNTTGVKKYILIFYMFILFIISIEAFVGTYQHGIFISFMNFIYFFIYILYFLSTYIISQENWKITIINFFIFVSAVDNVLISKFWKEIWDFSQRLGLVFDLLYAIYCISIFLHYILFVVIIAMWIVRLSYRNEMPR